MENVEFIKVLTSEERFDSLNETLGKIQQTLEKLVWFSSEIRRLEIERLTYLAQAPPGADILRSGG